MALPTDIALDLAGNIYIADNLNNVVRKVTAATGVISTVAGNGTPGFMGDGGVATSAELHLPTGIALDSGGNLYIADQGNEVIRKVAAATGVISTVAGNNTAGDAGDGGAAVSAELNFPNGVAVDSSGNLYIADEGNDVIRKVTAATGKISTVAGSGAPGYSGDGAAAISAKLSLPTAVAVDSSGNLYIADGENSVIRKVTAATGNISTLAGNGRTGYIGDGGVATSAELYYPYGIAVDTQRERICRRFQQQRHPQSYGGYGHHQHGSGDRHVRLQRGWRAGDQCGTCLARRRCHKLDWRDTCGGFRQ